MNEVIRPDQAQKRLACSRSMIYKLIRNGELEGFKVGSSWRIYEKSVKEYKFSRTVHTDHTQETDR
jgi:excisionase family DNA binding protein